jgi:DNA-binding XRE family transcriptional regulator
MAVVSGTTPLKQFRLDLGVGRRKVSQERLAHQAGTSLQTYRGAESGSEVLLSTAASIWRALNAERRSRGLSEVSFEQLWGLHSTQSEEKAS